MPATSANTAATLASVTKGSVARIRDLATGASADDTATIRRLIELGFVPGEVVRVLAKVFPGGYPMAVRLGNTTFALRRHEAAMIHIVLEQAT